MRKKLVRKFVEKLDYSYNYKTKNERQNMISELCEIAGIEQLTIPAVIKSICPLCDGKGRRVFPNCNPPIDEVCPACKGQTVL